MKTRRRKIRTRRRKNPSEPLQPEDIEQICAWCKKHISGPTNGKHKSHGMCSECQKTWLKPKVKNPPTLTPEKMFQMIIGDPFLYQRVYKPALTELRSQFLDGGTFNRKAWFRIMLNVSKRVTAEIEKKIGHKITLKDKLKLAMLLARNAWEQIVTKRKK